MNFYEYLKSLDERSTTALQIILAIVGILLLIIFEYKKIVTIFKFIHVFLVKNYHRVTTMKFSFYVLPKITFPRPISIIDVDSSPYDGNGLRVSRIDFESFEMEDTFTYEGYVIKIKKKRGFSLIILELNDHFMTLSYHDIKKKKFNTIDVLNSFMESDDNLTKYKLIVKVIDLNHMLFASKNYTPFREFTFLSIKNLFPPMPKMELIIPQIRVNPIVHHNIRHLF